MLKQMQENARIMEATLRRCQILQRGDDGLRQCLLELDGSIMNFQRTISNRLQALSDAGPEDPPLIWALRTALKNNPKLTDTDITCLVREALR
jgi:hypothetical protein